MSEAVTAEAAEAAGPATRGPHRTPARPVLSIALVMFVPAVVLVLDGNLSVQTALVRFAAALLVSWAAARLVWATVRSATSTTEAGDREVAGATTAPRRAASERAASERTGRQQTGTQQTASEPAAAESGMP
jgi:hypothetical protein